MTLPTATVGADEKPAPEQRAAPAVADKFRSDVAGLRAVAVGLVILFHAGVPAVSGGFVGVDVFFVISGFLITGQIVAEIERTGRVGLLAFYARRAKRILPAATVVLFATAAAVWLLLPRLRWQEIGGDIAAAATYVVNWRFADRAVDYLAGGSEPSPVQHFWSLAVEEQFYAVWPLLIVTMLVVARLVRRTNVRPLLWLGLVAVAVPSFVWSVVATVASPDRAFFISTTRMWELSIGAGVALLAARTVRMPRSVAIGLAWTGLAATVAAALLVTEHTAWPGYAAALPTLGAALVIAAGPAAGRAGPVRILGLRPFQWVGDLSYSLYLWHWPMLVVAAAWRGDLSVVQGLAVAAASVVPAWLTYRLVENPLRFSRAISASPRLALSLGGNFTLAGVCAGLAIVLLSASAVGSGGIGRTAPGAAVLLYPGAATADVVLDGVDFITPDPVRAGADVPDTTADGCFQQMVSAELLWCEYGVPDGATTIALVGDSKMDQWLPAFQALAPRNDWRLVVAFKGACAFSSAAAIKSDDPGQPYVDCVQWNKTLLARLVDERPDYVITSQGAARALDASGQATTEAMVEGMRASWTALTEIVAKIVVIANNPSPPLNVMQCADKNRTRLDACVFDRSRHQEDRAFRVQATAVAAMPSVALIDLFDTICPGRGACPPVVGDVLVYRRGSHVTATYARSMAPQLAQALTRIGVPARVV